MTQQRARLVAAIVVALTLIFLLAFTFISKADAHPRRTFTPCATDEGGEGQSIVPCVWDAKHQGNGNGRSFKVRKNRTLIHITHRRAHRIQEDRK